MPTDGSPQRLRIGAELRRLREAAQLSGEQVARTLGWSQPKVSRIEAGRTAFTVKDVAGLLAIYGITDDVRAELLGATAEDTGEGSWIVRAGGLPRRQGSIASLESVTTRIRHHQPIVIPGLLQTYDYACAVVAAFGASDPDGVAAERMQRQEMLKSDKAPMYEVVLDARALLLGVGDVDLIRNQLRVLADRAESLPRLALSIIPLGAPVSAFATSGFTIYDFRVAESPRVAWVETLAGDVYFSLPEDIERYSSLFESLQKVALTPESSVGYLRSLTVDIERYLAVPNPGGT